MSISNTTDFKSKLNKLGEDRTPFFFCISYDMQEYYVQRLEQLDKNILVNFPSYSNSIDKTSAYPNLQYDVHSKVHYAAQFEEVMKELQYGNSYLLNLTARHKLRTEIDLKTLFHSVNAPYRLKFFERFLCFSPEQFVSIKENKISTFPMKGTIENKGEQSLNHLLNNPKEISEHYTVVDLLRNDLSMVSDNVHVEAFRSVSEIKSRDKNLYQTSSHITGTLNENYHNHIGDIIATLLPAGSISGAPKKKTLEIIDHLEDYKRGYYTGIAGIYDGNNLDSCVIIRCLQMYENEYYYHSGGGITALSNMEDEYQELIDKIYVPTS